MINRNVRLLEPLNSSINKDGLNKLRQKHFKNNSYNESMSRMTMNIGVNGTNLNIGAK
jgi:hypothetical protein